MTRLAYYNITFINNSATNGGHHIYGASLRSYCVVYALNGTSDPLPVRSYEVQSLIFHIEGGEDSPVSSPPSRVCLLGSEAPNRSIGAHCTDVTNF